MREFDPAQSELLGKKLAATPATEVYAYDNPDYTLIAAGETRATNPDNSMYATQVYVGKLEGEAYFDRILASPVAAIQDQIGKHPLLDDATTNLLLDRYRTGNDLEAKDTLVLHNLGLAVMGSKVIYRKAKAQATPVEFADILQESIIGLARAVETHNPIKAAKAGSTKFSTWAMYYIYGRAGRFVDCQNIVRIPVHVQKEINDVSMKELEVLRSEGRAPTTEDLYDDIEPTPELLERATEDVKEPDPFERRFTEQQIGLAKQRVEEIAAATGSDVEKVKRLLQVRSGRRVIDITILPEDYAVFVENADAGPLSQAVLADRRERVVKAVTDRRLGKRETAILMMRYGLDDSEGHTLDSLAEIFDVTRERIRQIENHSLKQLIQTHIEEELRELRGTITDDLDTAAIGVVTPIRDPLQGAKLTRSNERDRTQYLELQAHYQRERSERQRKYAAQDEIKRIQARSDRKRMIQGEKKSKPIPLLIVRERKDKRDLLERTKKERDEIVDDYY